MLWVNCQRELISIKDTIEGLNLDFPQKVSDSKSNSFSYECLLFSKGNIREFLNAVHPDLKQSVADCLRRNRLPFRVNGEETVSDYWYTEYLKSMSSRLNTQRRFLATSSPTSVAGAAAPGPGISSGPGLSPSPSSTIDPGSTPPAPPPKEPFFPPSFGALSPQALVSQDNSSATPGSSSNEQFNKGNGNRRAVVIAVVVTASVTFLLAVFLFVCYNKFRSRIRTGRNDDRPLLSLSMADYSVGIIR